MTALRFVCVVALCFAVAVSAAGGYSSCGPISRAYSNVSCTAAATCGAARCTCFGGTASNGECTGASTTASCDKGRDCAMDFLKCINDAANMLTNTSACYAPLAALHDSFVLLVSGAQQWNASVAFMSCNWEVCKLYNATTSGTCNSTNNYQSVCMRSPITYTGQFILSGNFSKIVLNATALAALKECLATDLTNHLRYPTWIISVSKNADDTITVVFNVGAPKSAIDSELIKAAGNTNWMTCLSAAKFAELGGVGTLGGPTFGETPTPSPPGTTPTPGSPSPSTPAPSSAAIMWSAAPIISAVVAILMIA
jgi:hypothetical protein